MIKWLVDLKLYYRASHRELVEGDFCAILIYCFKLSEKPQGRLMPGYTQYTVGYAFVTFGLWFSSIAEDF